MKKPSEPTIAVAFLAALVVAMAALVAMGQTTITVTPNPTLADVETFTDRRDREVTSTIVLAKGDGVPVDLHDPRGAGGRVSGQSMTLTEMVCGSEVTGAMIQSDDYGVANSYGQSVSQLHLLGNQTLNAPLHINHAAAADVAHAINLYGKGHIVERNIIELFKGTAVFIDYDNTEAASLPTNPVNYVRNNIVQRCFGGIVTTMADAEITDNTVIIVRDYGCWVKGGNSKLSGNHFWGAGIAAVRLGVDGTSGAMQMDFTDASDATIGCIVSSNACKITNCYSQGCITNFQVVGTGLTFANNHVRVSRNADFNPDNDPITGLHFEATAHAGSVRGSTFIMDDNGPASNTPNIGVKVESHAIDIDDVTVLGDGSNNVTGVYIDSANLMGGVYEVKATGFTGTSAVAVHIVSWGDNNTLYIRGLAAEDGSPPTDAGAMVKIDAEDWGTGNRIFVNGIELTEDQAYPPAE